MKKRYSLLPVLALVLCLCAFACAEEAVHVEVIKMDGVSVVMLTPETTLQRAKGIAEADVEAGKKADFVLPQVLTVIEKEAFMGIAAKSVEVSENVVAIEAAAFADCVNLRKIVIPSTVREIDSHAMDGCKGVKVYGEKGSAAERFVAAVNAENPGAGFVFVELKPGTSGGPYEREKPTVVLPFVPAGRP